MVTSAAHTCASSVEDALKSESPTFVVHRGGQGTLSGTVFCRGIPDLLNRVEAKDSQIRRTILRGRQRDWRIARTRDAHFLWILRRLRSAFRRSQT